MRLSNIVALGLALCAVAAAQQPPTLRLTLEEARARARQRHPRVLASTSEALAANQRITAARSAYMPVVEADITATQGNNDARLGAGALSASRLFDRVGQGVSISQLVTDMGRTSHLVSSARSQAAAAQQHQIATAAEAVLAVELAYARALEARAVIRVAEETVQARERVLAQVNALAQNKLKSKLDASFAEVNLSDARLMLIRSQANVEQADAELAEAIGLDQHVRFELVEQELPPAPPDNTDSLIAQAVVNRPELAALRHTATAAHDFAVAESDLRRPTVTAVATAGLLPWIHASGVPNEYEAVGLNLSVPVFNGHLFSARAESARQQASAADYRLAAERLAVARDVRIAWANASTAHRRLDVSARFVEQAKLALELAQGRYDLGLSSIVELTQAQLNLTRAEIEDLAAKADYHVQYSTLQFTLGTLR